MNKEAKYTQENLLEGITNSSYEIIEYLYSNTFQGIRHFVHTNSGNDEDAKETFQSAMVIMYQKLRNADFRLTCSPETFLFSICKYVWLKELSYRKRYAKIDYDNDEIISDKDDLFRMIERNDRLKLYREKFEELSNDCKRILKMTLNSISINEITKIMGYKSVQHTKNRQFRCKMSLIKRIRSSEKYKELSYGNTTSD